MAIKNSLDWNSEGIRLQQLIYTSGYNPDLQKIFNNISKMIDDLSKLEVDARRTQKFSYTETKVLQINQAISHLDNLLIMAILMK